MLKKFYLGMILAFFAFAGLTFCSPPAPANNFKFTTEEHIMCLANNMYWESRNQSMTGMRAVGLVTMNRVKDERFPHTVCEVVFQAPTIESWRGEWIPVRNKCQFSWYCDGKSDKIPSVDKNLYEILLKQARDIYYGTKYNAIEDFTQGATHYHADYVYPEWRKSKTQTIVIDNHIFYRWEKVTK
tara:strand:+ start:122 stop:676 length:555 start_codon:yes stop_codon:yes gene_type:complete